MTMLADRIKDARAQGSTESVPYFADIKQIRRSNMRELIGREPSKAAFARKVGTDPAYISQLLSDKTRAEIGDAFARNVEKTYELPHGWMDNVHAQSKSESAGTELIERIQGRLDSLLWGWADLARAMEMTEQRLNNWKTRGVPARELRKVEAALKLPRYALDVDAHQQEGEHAALLEAWGYLLPAEKQAIMEQIRLKATHNKAVLEQLQKS